MGASDGSDTDLTDGELELLQRRAQRYAKKPDADVDDPLDAIVFLRGGAKYAAPLNALREIRPLRMLCRIPGAASTVPGVFHYRGEILSAHDLHAFLGMRDECAQASWVLIVEHEGDRLGVMADEVLRIEPVASAKIAAVPLTLGDRGGCFRGVIDDGIMLLRPDMLFATPSFYLAFT